MGFGKASTKIMKKLHSIQQQLLELIKENQGEVFGIRELQRILKLNSPGLISHHLKQLEKKECIRRSITNSSMFHIIEKEGDNFFYIPFYGQAHCGLNGRLLRNNPEKHISFPKDFFTSSDKNLIAVKAKGDSMEPRIMNNALVIARNDKNIRNNDIIVCTFEDEVLVKKYKQYTNNIYVLESINPKYEPRFITKEASFHPTGKVIHVFNTFK